MYIHATSRQILTGSYRSSCSHTQACLASGQQGSELALKVPFLGRLCCLWVRVCHWPYMVVVHMELLELPLPGVWSSYRANCLPCRSFLIGTQALEFSYSYRTAV